LATVDARYFGLSYNTDGIIPFDELVELKEQADTSRYKVGVFS